MASQVIDLANGCAANVPGRRSCAVPIAMPEATAEPVAEASVAVPTHRPFFTDGWAIEDDIWAERLARAGE